jgi:hypothetical protein
LGAQRRHPPVRGLRTPWRPGRAAVLASSPGSRERDRGASRAGRAPRAARDWRGGGSPARKRLMCATACWPHLLPVLQAHVAGQLVQRWRRARGRASGGVRGERTCAGTQAPLRESAAPPSRSHASQPVPSSPTTGGGRHSSQPDACEASKQRRPPERDTACCAAAPPDAAPPAPPAAWPEAPASSCSSHTAPRSTD